MFKTMKKLLGIIVLGLLLSGCSFNERVNIIQEAPLVNDFNETEDKLRNLRALEKGGVPVFVYFHGDGVLEIDHVEFINIYEKLKKDIDYKFKASKTFISNGQDIYFVSYGSTYKKAEDKLILSCEDYNQKNNLSMNCLSLKKRSTKLTPIGRLLDKGEVPYVFAKKQVKEKREFEINQVKIKKEIKAQKLIDNKNRCEEIGFTPQTESFAKCVLKLIELAEIRESALIESRSRASLEADMQQQQIDIQDQIAAEAKASRDQQAWGVLLGMTMGSGILDTSSGGLFSPSTVSCNKTGETTSGTNKICYYNCMGSTKTINVGSMQFCPININK